MIETKKKLTPKERKEMTATLRIKQQAIFDNLGISDAIYIPKMAHFVTGLEGLHMGFFESELDHGQDVYTEKVSSSMESEDPDRVLYKIPYNPHFKDEYETSEPLSNGSVRYFIPVDEMIVVDVNTSINENEFNFMDPDQDRAMDQLSIRDLAAILWKRPVSQKPWLNNLIKKEFNKDGN